MRVVALLIAGILSLSVTSLSADTYRWKDKDGKVHYGAMVPAEYADQPYDVLNKSGLVIRHVENTTIPLELIVAEEIQSKKPLISDVERKRQSDRLLVIQYQSEEDINKALELELTQLGYDSKLIKQSQLSTSTAIRDQIRLAADQQRSNRKISKDQKKGIDKLYARLAQDERNMVAMAKREDRIRARFQAKLERYRFLTLEQKKPNEEHVDQG